MTDSYEENNWMIAWTPDLLESETPALEVGPWPDTTGWSGKYSCTSGCCYGHFHSLEEKGQAKRLMNEAASLMFQGIPPQRVLEEFSKIRVWREMRVAFTSGSYQAFCERFGYTTWAPHNE